MPAKKLPYLQLYVGDFLRDMSFAPLEVVGAWIKTLCHLHQADERGKMTLTEEEWARLFGEMLAETNKTLRYFSEKKIADVTFSDAGVTVVSRRMRREEKDKKAARLRKQRERESRKCHGDVTQGSHKSHNPYILESEIRDKKKKNTKKKNSAPDGALCDQFEEFWEAYPKDGKRNTSKKLTKTKYIAALKKADHQTIMSGVSAMVRQKAQAPPDTFIPRPPMPTTWLNQEKWDADYSIPEPEGNPQPQGSSIWDMPVEE